MNTEITVNQIIKDTQYEMIGIGGLPSIPEYYEELDSRVRAKLGLEILKASEEKAVDENERREEFRKFLTRLHENDVSLYYYPDDDWDSVLDKFLNSK